MVSKILIAISIWGLFLVWASALALTVAWLLEQFADHF